AFLERSVAFMKRYSDFTNVVATGLWPVHTPHGFTPGQTARRAVATANGLVGKPRAIYLLIANLLWCRAPIVRRESSRFLGAGWRSRANQNRTKMQCSSPAARGNGIGARQERVIDPGFKLPMCRNWWSTARKQTWSRVERPRAFTFPSRRWWS